MIKKIEIHNIQSHENTVLELSNGINAIVGSSNNGKTAILRALNWARYNRPLGIDNLASHWIVNDKGDLTDEMFVTIENENGVVTRKRTKNENQYIVNGKELNVVKTDVPDEVESLLSLSETNIQNQQDSPFLISKSSGEVAKYFNKVVRLDIIDKVLSNAESKRRSVKNDITFTENQIKKNESLLENYSWIDKVERLLEKYERVEQWNSELKDGVELLKSQLKKYVDLQAIVSKYDFSEQEKLVEKIEKLDGEMAGQRMNLAQIRFSVDKYKSVGVYPDLTKEEKLIEKIENWNDEKLKKDIKTLKEQVYMYGIQQMHIKDCDADIKCLEQQLPDICPFCGNPMNLCKGGKHEKA